MSVLCQHRLRASRAGHRPEGWPANMDKRMQAGESISVQKLNSPHGGQVHYTDAAGGHQMTSGGLWLSSYNVAFC